MRTIAFCNLKGGVAKTVTTVNVAAILARDHGKRVLVIDADSQANATEFFGGDGGGTLADLLQIPQAERTAFSRVVSAVECVRPTKLPGVDILPADDRLMDLDLSRLQGGDVYVEVLRDLLPDLAVYDYCLIDCPPAFNAASAAALLAADGVVIPIKLDAFSLRGMGNLMRQVSNMRLINPSLRVAGLLPTMVYRSDVIESASAVLKQSGLRIFSPIRRTPKVDDMTFAQRPLIESSPKSSACKDYRRFVKELMGGANNG